jgi:bifunctional DNase/RNase
MKRKELKILGLSYSQSQIGSYVIVLSEKGGNRKLPLVIKTQDAQRIALEIEGIKPPKPLTHDLIKSIGDVMGYDISEVFIHTLAEGIFYTKIILNNGLEDFEIESSAGDALAMAVIYKAPIYVNKSILDSAGIFINDDGTPFDEDVNDDLSDDDDDYSEGDRIVSIDDLERLMEEAIKNEEYEIAAEIRDRIQKLKG